MKNQSKENPNSKGLNTSEKKQLDKEIDEEISQIEVFGNAVKNLKKILIDKSLYKKR